MAIQQVQDCRVEKNGIAEISELLWIQGKAFVGRA